MNNILKLFLEKGFLLDKEMLEFLNEIDDNEVANEILDKINEGGWESLTKQEEEYLNLASKKLFDDRPPN